MTTDKAAPRPWRKDAFAMARSGLAIVAKCGARTNARAQANAALIVAAVNAYDAHRELVTVAIHVLRELEAYNEHGDWNGEISNLRAALAKAANHLTLIRDE
jgi:hypothetical protein